jgi:hypothetical protein
MDTDDHPSVQAALMYFNSLNLYPSTPNVYTRTGYKYNKGSTPTAADYRDPNNHGLSHVVGHHDIL